MEEKKKLGSHDQESRAFEPAYEQKLDQDSLMVSKQSPPLLQMSHRN
jgi:hypothetical protein